MPLPNRDMQRRCFTMRSVSQLSLAIALICFAVPLLFYASLCPCRANPCITFALPSVPFPAAAKFRYTEPLLCSTSHCAATLFLCCASPRHSLPLQCSDSRTLPWRCFAALSAAFASLRLALLNLAVALLNCATLYHCLVMLVYTLPLPHYSLLRSTLPLRYISVLHDAAPLLINAYHCFPHSSLLHSAFAVPRISWLCHCPAVRRLTLPLPRRTVPCRCGFIPRPSLLYLSFAKHSHCFSEQLTTLPLHLAQST